MKKIILLIVFLSITSCGQNVPLKKEKVVKKYKSIISNGIGMDLVYIKPGTFMMGLDYELDNYSIKELPHKVTLTKGFYMQTTETTVGQWKKFIEETGYKTMAEREGLGSFQEEIWTNSNPLPKLHALKKFWNYVGDKYPVTMVTWIDCIVFLKWLSSKEKQVYRLPTEAEWEYASRAGEKTHFPGGNLTKEWKKYERNTSNFNLDRVAWYNMNSDRKLHRVGAKKANKWGLFDIVGNVNEYCQDSFTKNFPKNHVKDYVHIVTQDIEEIVIKGGSWHDPEFLVTSYSRDSCYIYSSNNTIGFRVVKNVSENDYETRELNE